MFLLQCYQYFTTVDATMTSTFYPTVLLNLRSNRAPLLSCVMYIPYVTYVSTSLTYLTHARARKVLQGTSKAFFKEFAFAR